MKTLAKRFAKREKTEKITISDYDWIYFTIYVDLCINATLHMLERKVTTLLVVNENPCEKICNKGKDIKD